MAGAPGSAFPQPAFPLDYATGQLDGSKLKVRDVSFVFTGRERQRAGPRTWDGDVGLASALATRMKPERSTGWGRGGGADVIPLNISGLRLYPM